LVKCLATSGYPDGSRSGGPERKWKNSHPAVVEHDCPDINSSQRWFSVKSPMWFGATETWTAASLFSLARRKTTSCGNGWFETTRRHVYTTGIRLLYCEMERPGNLPSYPSKQHYGLCRHKGKHSGSDVARLNKVCFPCRATRAGSKNRLLTGSTMMKNTMKLRLGTWKSSTTR